jgi:DNA mismatch repair protein MutS
MQSKKETPIMAQYRHIKAQYPDCLVFFRLGDFYELFGQDAQVASQELGIVLTARHKNSAQEMPMCGVPFHASQAYVAKLVKRGFKVAICEQLEDAQTKEGKGIVHRDVVRVITAGTLLEDDLLEARENNYLMALTCENDQFALACVDISTGDFLVESHDYRSLEEALYTLSPKEILLPERVWKLPHLEGLWQSKKK